MSNYHITNNDYNDSFVISMRGDCIKEINEIEELKDYLFYTEFVIIICFATFGIFAYILVELEGENVDDV
mgnify:FL=1